MNYALILFCLTLVTGLIALIDRLTWAKARKAAGFPKNTELLDSAGQVQYDAKTGETLMTTVSGIPWWIDLARGLFPIALAVFVLRSFIAEPFRIPSSSMRPLLEVGDFILVNKFTYGIRLPVLEKKIIEVGKPQRGDVMVFRYPGDPSIDYIKRVIGLPGDHIAYRNKQLFINGTLIPNQANGLYNYLEQSGRGGVENVVTERRLEDLPGKRHAILHDNRKLSLDLFMVAPELAQKYCQLSEQGYDCTVPTDHYFMMGDNRDNSSDGRVWGFVADEYIRGKAFFIWFNFAFDKTPTIDFHRIGNRVE